MDILWVVITCAALSEPYKNNTCGQEAIAEETQYLDYITEKMSRLRSLMSQKFSA